MRKLGGDFKISPFVFGTISKRKKEMFENFFEKLLKMLKNKKNEQRTKKRLYYFKLFDIMRYTNISNTYV